MNATMVRSKNKTPTYDSLMVSQARETFFNKRAIQSLTQSGARNINAYKGKLKSAL
jgi:hypothetical protein